jgi:type I restriction enzyme M protein
MKKITRPQLLAVAIPCRTVSETKTLLERLDTGTAVIREVVAALTRRSAESSALKPALLHAVFRSFLVARRAKSARLAPTGIAGLNSAIWSICDVLRRSKCAGAMQYVPELTWILFLRVLDDKEKEQQDEAEAVGAFFSPSLSEPYRWRDWAAPNGAKRKELEAGKLGSFFGFVNGDLIPHLKSLAQNPNATARQKIIGEALSGVEKTRVDTEKNLLDVLDRVDALNLHAADGTHMFPLSQVCEGLLLKMGDKGSDGGQFFTPREVIRVIVRTIDPKPGETIYDPGCGTAGFLAEAFEHVRSNFKSDATGEEVEALGTRTLFGREKEDLVYPLALANLMLHGVERPHI